MVSRYALAGLAGLALSGCVSLGPKPPKALITLTPTTTVTVDSVRKAGPGETITILYPTAPTAIAVPRVPVYNGDGPLTYVADVAWNDTPTRLFQRLLTETVAAKTGKVVLDLRQFTMDPGLRVSGTLQNFGIDARAMQAVVTYDAIVTRAGNIIETRRFEARVQVSAIDAVSVGVPLNQAANTVAAQVAGWIGG